MTAAVYQELLRQAEHRLGMGQSVVLEASWTDNSWRDAARSLSNRTCSDLAELRCQATPHLAADRIARRLENHTDISEATPEIGRAMSRSADPWPSAIVVDTAVLAPDEAVTKALVALSRDRGNIDNDLIRRLKRRRASSSGDGPLNSPGIGLLALTTRDSRVVQPNR